MAAAVFEDRSGSAAEQAWERQQMNEDLLAWYLKTSRLALALAIIGCTPTERSSREYTEQLAKSLCKKGVEWKLKAEAWKAEVLYLRQELFLTRMRFAARSNDYIEADSCACLECPTQDPMKFMNESTHPEDSGCDVSNGQGSDTQDLSANCGTRCFDFYSLTTEKILPLVNSTLPNATSYVASGNELQVNKKMLNFHTQFLQSLIRIRKIASNRTPTGETLTLDGDYSVVTDSVSHFAESLLVFCTNPKFLPQASLLMEAVESLVCLMQEGKLPTTLLAQCIKRVEKLVKKLVKVILDNTEVNRFQEQRLVAELLIVLGRCHSFSTQVFATLLSGINHFIDYLWHINQASFLAFGSACFAEVPGAILPDAITSVSKTTAHPAVLPPPTIKEPSVNRSDPNSGGAFLCGYFHPRDMLLSLQGCSQHNPPCPMATV